MKATIVGTLTGLTAAVAMMWLGTRSPAVRQAPATPNTGQQALADRFIPNAHTAEVRRKLAIILPAVKCDAMPLSKFISWLEDSTGLNIYIEWRDIAAASAVGPDSPITMNVQNVSAGTVLQLALDQARLTGPRVCFVPLEGIVKVSTLSKLDRAVMIRVYDVRDIIEAAVEMKLRLQPKSPPDVLIDGNPNLELEAASRLQELIRTTTPPQMLDDTDAAQMSYFAGRLVISQTEAGHEAIAAILSGLHAAQGQKR